MSGKGSAPRPKSVDDETFGDNWDRTFGDEPSLAGLIGEVKGEPEAAALVTLHANNVQVNWYGVDEVNAAALLKRATEITEDHLQADRPARLN